MEVGEVSVHCPALLHTVEKLYSVCVISTGLPSQGCSLPCRYAKLEMEVGEVDRARAIFVHGSSLANPGVDKAFWQAWNDFEVAHGNEDTFREMRRIMRSVNASFSQTHFNTAVIDSVAQPTASGEPPPPAPCRHR